MVMNVERDELLIDAEYARIFARAIYRDIASYIQDHQEEYRAFLLEEAEDDNGKTTTTHRPKRGNSKAE